MLKAIEWRTVLGVVLILAGSSLAKWMHGYSLGPHIQTGFLATVLPTCLVGLYLRAYGIPIRVTLQLLSLPVGFYVSLLLTLQGSIDSRFFEGGVYAAIAGGFLTLCSYRADALDPTSSPSVNFAQIAPAIFFLILAPVLLMELMIAEVDFLRYRQPSEILTAFSALFGIVLLQKKGGDSYARYQFAACYAIVLITALMVANSLQLFYLLEVAALYDVSVESHLSMGLAPVAALLLGTAIYAAVVLVSIARGKTEGIMLKNWHISEGYIFLTFMLIAPQSLYETIANAAS